MPAWSAMTALGKEMLGEIPGWLRDDPDTRSVIHCHAKETERQLVMAAGIRDDCIPLRAGGRGLEWWEKYFDMTVNPPGQTLEQRRAAVLGRLKREPPLGAGISWQEGVTLLIGGGWTYEEFPAEKKIRVVVPFPPSSEVFNLADQQIPRMASWPCHLELELVSVEGFVLDLSELDEEPFEAP
jgi:hypothetical protein